MKLLNFGNRKLKLFIIPLVIMMSISGIVLYWMYSIEDEISNNAVNKDIKNHLKLIAENIERDLNTVYSDLVFLKEYSEEVGVNNYGCSDSIRLSRAFKLFSKNRKTYDQIRLINKVGNEVVRINYDNGECNVVDSEELQNKSSRYYFSETIDLQDDMIFISPLDLNIENNIVEKPYKPVIRFGIPINDEANKRAGVIITNFYGQRILDNIIDYNSELLNLSLKIEMVNQDGFFVKTLERENEWGFMFNEIHDKNNFSIENDDLWKKIFNHKQYSEISDKEKYFSYQININRLNDSDYGVKTIKDKWILLARLPHSAVNIQTDLIRMRYIYVYLLLIIGYIIIAYLWMTYNIKKEEYTNKLNELAYYDKLTGLANRLLFMETLTNHLDRLTRYEEISALYFLDLDGFKKINDNYGHEAGDLVLKEVGKRLNTAMRQSDTIGRIGGDEFNILAINIESKNEAEKIAQRLVSEISKVYIINGQRMKIGVSIGVVMLPEDGLERESIIKKADEAMYYVKNHQKNNYKFFKELKK